MRLLLLIAYSALTAGLLACTTIPNQNPDGQVERPAIVFSEVNRSGSTRLVYFGDAGTNLCFAYLWQENGLLDSRAGGPGLTWVPCSVLVCKQLTNAAELPACRLFAPAETPAKQGGDLR